MPAHSFAAPTGKRRRMAVAELTPQDMAAKLLATGFERSGPSAATLSDPIADTPMVVTLDQLRPYDHDPRVTRNPAYAEIKASIRERGLDAPPAITRRPGEAHYIIRNGGNTRLAILRELWSETKAIRAARIEDAATKTLGTLIGQLFGSYVVTDGNGGEERDDDLPGDVISFRTRVQLSLSAQDYAKTQADLKDLVSLRNTLVHHFIDQHDLWTVDGCRAAQDELGSAYTRIDQHFEQLRGWAEHMDQARRLAAEFVQSDVFHDLVVNGIAPDGTVDWPAAGIVRALREAAAQLAVEGWTPIAAAGRWIADRHPEQLPAKYGCSSWRQVVHECRLFELRYREVEGQRAAWYRPREA